MDPDSQLLLRTVRGDEAAARDLWSRFGPPLVAFAESLSRGGGRLGGADAVQTVFCRLLQLDAAAIARIKDVRAYLARSVRHALINAARDAGRAAAREHAVPHAATVAPASHTELRAMIDSLPDDLREVVLLKHIAGLTFDQIALSLDEHRSTIASRYRRAIDTMQAAARAPQEVRT